MEEKDKITQAEWKLSGLCTNCGSLKNKIVETEQRFIKGGIDDPRGGGKYGPYVAQESQMCPDCGDKTSIGEWELR